MGIAPSIAAFITNCCVTLGRKGEDAGRCLTLGKQAVHISETQLYQILGTQGVISLTDDNQVVIPEWLAEVRNRLAEQDSIGATIAERRQSGEISDLMFLKALGLRMFTALTQALMRVPILSMTLTSQVYRMLSTVPMTWFLILGQWNIYLMCQGY